jgi:hypothetical protein
LERVIYSKRGSCVSRRKIENNPSMALPSASGLMGSLRGEADFVASQSATDRHEFSTGRRCAGDHLETLPKLQLGLPELPYPPAFAWTIQKTYGGNSLQRLNIYANDKRSKVAKKRLHLMFKLKGFGTDYSNTSFATRSSLTKLYPFPLTSNNNSGAPTIKPFFNTLLLG